ncbi:MAG: MoaD/ThiS family protein [Betaproteobacteria bacterium]|jgi:molybdopterin synthase sulfur carrier subunit|nr:MoaD/ThiS family protein [Betaproteobacteria bacterium]
MPRRLQILLFASLRERLQQEALEMDWPGGSLRELRAVLVALGPAWADFAHPPRVRAAVNQVMASEETRVEPGDEVAFFPPVTGG